MASEGRSHPPAGRPRAARRRVQPVSAGAVGEHRERVGNVGVGDLAPAGRHRQRDVERQEVPRVLRFQCDALLVEEVGERARTGRHEGGGAGRRPGAGWSGPAGRPPSSGSPGRAPPGWPPPVPGPRLRGRGRGGCDSDGLGDRDGYRGGRGRLGRFGSGGGPRETHHTGDARGDTARHYPPATGVVEHRLDPSGYASPGAHVTPCQRPTVAAFRQDSGSRERAGTDLESTADRSATQLRQTGPGV